MTKEVETLIKLLALTTSSNDHECLVAIRKANAMLAARNITWEFFIKGRYPNVEVTSPKHSTSIPEADEVERMFEAVIENSSGSFSDFVTSIYQWWEEKGSLTDRQFDALKSAYERIR